MAERLNVFELGRIPLLERWQQHFLAFQGRIGIITALHVGTEETRKINALSTGTEHRISSTQINGQHGEAGLSHLAGDGALPDQLIESEIPAIETCLLWSTKTLTGRTNRFMRLLCIAGLGAELPGPLAQIVLAVTRFHTAAGSADRLIREMHRIGAHVGDETTLIQTLRTTHGFPGRKPKLAV